MEDERALRVDGEAAKRMVSHSIQINQRIEKGNVISKPENDNNKKRKVEEIYENTMTI